MTFIEYLASKKIDPDSMRMGEPGLWEKWKIEFEQMNPNSFSSRKLYQINSLRRKYRLKEEAPSKPASTTAAKPRPVIRPKMN